MASSTGGQSSELALAARPTRLGDICDLNMGQSPNSGSYNSSQNGLPFYQGNADFGDINPTPRVWCSSPTKIAQPGDILISVRAPIGALNFAAEKCCIGRGLAAITVHSGVDPWFVYHALGSKVEDLNLRGTGSTFKAINKKALEDTLIPFYSYHEQRRVASILEGVRKLRKNAETRLAKLDVLEKASFAEMFGDLAANPKNWPVVPFSTVGSIDGSLTTDYEKFADCPHIGIDSIEKNSGRLFGYRTVKEDAVISGKYHFTPAHIIYSKIRPNLNKVALPNFEGLCSADAYAILPTDLATREFLAFVLRSDTFLRYIVPLSGRTGMPKANRKQIYGFRLPLPPLSLQRLFSQRIQAIDKSKDILRETIVQLDTLYRSKLQEYFG